ncbi:MAG: hypothetical protein WDW36_004943 [Sanguina aurantia]
MPLTVSRAASGRSKKLAKEQAACHLLEDLIAVLPTGSQEFVTRIRLPAPPLTTSPLLGASDCLADSYPRCHAKLEAQRKERPATNCASMMNDLCAQESRKVRYDVTPYGPPFTTTCTMFEMDGATVVATVTGKSSSSKQEAKHSAAAALMEHLLAAKEAAEAGGS